MASLLSGKASAEPAGALNTRRKWATHSRALHQLICCYLFASPARNPCLRTVTILNAIGLTKNTVSAIQQAGTAREKAKVAVHKRAGRNLLNVLIVPKLQISGAEVHLHALSR